MRKSFIAYIFVLIQFICLIYIGMTGPVLSISINGLLVQVAGLVLGISAILQMGIGNFNIAPLPKSGGELITAGIYSMLRHPMYLAQLLVVVPLIVDYFSWPRLVALLILFIDLLLKLHYEENNLKRQFAEYEDYMRKTWRLVPYFY
jgi:protein-S-isoprenylcysteine O-methyltransferase Ste14